MDRESVARACRRRQAGEALEFEQERALVLRAQLEEIVTELHGPQLDEELFARMAPADVAVVREALGDAAYEDPGESPDEVERLLLERREEQEEEIARLQGLIDESGQRQQAFERYLDGLGR